MAGFSAKIFLDPPDRDLSLIMLKAYNDWHIDDWCGAYPGRFIPLGVVPLWDPIAAAEEVRRLATRGCRAISLPEAPHALGLPSFQSDHWDPVLRAMSDVGSVLCLHIGISHSTISLAEGVPDDHRTILGPMVGSMLTATDILWGPLMRKFPALKIALSEGGSGGCRSSSRESIATNGYRAPGPSRTSREATQRGHARPHSGLLHQRPRRSEIARPDRDRPAGMGVRLSAFGQLVASLARGAHGRVRPDRGARTMRSIGSLTSTLSASSITTPSRLSPARGPRWRVQGASCRRRHEHDFPCRIPGPVRRRNGLNLFEPWPSGFRPSRKREDRARE